MSGAARERVQRHATWRRTSASRPFVGWAFGFYLRVLRRLSLPWLQAVGGAAGTMATWCPNDLRRTTRTNLRLVYPDLIPRERERLAALSLTHTGRTMLEVVPALAWPPGRALALVAEVVGLESISNAGARGRGVIIAALHMSAWEIGALYCRTHLHAATIYRPTAIAEIDAQLARARARAQTSGRVLLANPSGLRTAIQILESGGRVALMIDQDPGPRSGVFVPFMGVEAHTSVLLPRLIQRTGARVVIGWFERLDAARGFRLHFEPVTDDVYGPDLVSAARAINAHVERVVRRLPEQYLWTYKRFRIRPGGGANPYQSAAGLQQMLDAATIAVAPKRGGEL